MLTAAAVGDGGYGEGRGGGGGEVIDMMSRLWWKSVRF